MRCPHCGVSIHLKIEYYTFPEMGDIGDCTVTIKVGFCPECNNPIINMDVGHINDITFDGYNATTEQSQRIFPLWEKATTLNDAIPEKYAKIFRESEQVNNISPMASATLSRYLLQMLLHEELHISKRNLEEEINELENKNNVPSELVKMLQVMRRVANFGAHPKKSTNSNEIIEVGAGESVVMLELLQQLFDYLFVKPKQQEEFLKNIEEKYGIKT